MVEQSGYILTLSGDNSQFTGTYDCENGTMIFACATSGKANLIDNGYVGFTSAATSYGFGDLSDNGDGTSTLDITNAGAVTFTLSSQDVFSGSVADSGVDNLAVAGSGAPGVLRHRKCWRRAKPDQRRFADLGQRRRAGDFRCFRRRGERRMGERPY